MKAIFLKAIEYCGSTVLVALPKQIDEKGRVISTDLQCVSRLNEFTLETDSIYATNMLTEKNGNYYVCGSVFHKITNDLGLIYTGTGDEKYEDSTHAEWCEQYRAYLSGVPYEKGMKEKTSQKSGEPPVKTFMQKLEFDTKLKPPTVEDDGWYIDRDLWYYLIRNLHRRKNTLLIGKSGSGKTELVQMMTNKMNRELSVFDMAVSNPNKTFCGNLRAENGTTVYQYARFAKNIQKKGVILMDELSRAAPTANNILLPVLDGRRTLFVEDAITEPEIKVHEECVFWATANIGSEFIGTSALDHALLNRFMQVGIEYPPQEKEALLLQKRYNLGKRESEQIAHSAHLIRNNKELTKDISTRQLFDVAELVADGYTVFSAYKWTVLQQFESDDIDGGERAKVLSILQSL